MGCLRAGLTVLLISPRNAPGAVVHLLNKTSAKYLFTSSDPSTKVLVDAVMQQIQSESRDPPIGLRPMPQFEALFPLQADASIEPYPPRTYDVESSGLILHSSGLFPFLINHLRVILTAISPFRP